MFPPAPRVVVVGAGIGGLAAAIDLARQGLAVTVVERQSVPGGKLREVAVGAARIDAGPTVFTMRDVFERLFADAGTTLDAHLTLRPATVLARHAWAPDARLDLYADLERSAAAIGEFAGAADAHRFLAFSAEAARIYATLNAPFIRAPRPSPFELVQRTGLTGLPDLWRIRPFTRLADALATRFADPRLRQLFGRYATYCGSSPYAAPALLMLVAHVEREGVWFVDGGMHRLATALAGLAAAQGARLRYAAPVAEVLVAGGRAAGVRLADGETLAADAVVVNADPAALPLGHLGAGVRAAVRAPRRAERSLSALVWALVARTSGLPLAHHTVFFSADYAAEFDDLFVRGRLPRAPTVYVCAQDRDAAGAHRPGPERLLVLVNAPPCGDTADLNPSEIASCEERSFGLLQACGLDVRRDRANTVATTPADFERLFPGTGGALYGPAAHGWRASFRRPDSRTRLPGLYLAGGSTHPGPGMPMAALSGRLAASRLLADLASTHRYRPAATPGGMSMLSATTAARRSR